MGEVATDFQGEIMADRTRCSLSWTGRSHGLADGCDRIWPFPDHGHNWCRGDISDQAIVKRFAFMDGIVCFCQFLADLHESVRDIFEWPDLGDQQIGMQYAEIEMAGNSLQTVRIQL